MVYDRGLPGLLARLKDRPKGQLAVIGGGVLAVIILVVVLITSLGGGESEPGVGSGMAAGGDGVAGGPFSGPEFEERLAEDVAATVAALEPTATPEPTLDISATVIARLGSETRGSDEMALSRVLQGSDYRSPILRKSERVLLEDLGAVFWEGVLVYFALAEVVSVDFGQVSWTLVEDEVRMVDFVLGIERVRDDEDPRASADVEWASVEDRERTSRSQEDVDPLVDAYVEEVWGTLEGLRQAALDLRTMNELFHASGVEYVVEMDPENRAELEGLYLGISHRLKEFDRLISRYGCSICGELFRQEPLAVE